MIINKAVAIKPRIFTSIENYSFSFLKLSFLDWNPVFIKNLIHGFELVFLLLLYRKTKKRKKFLKQTNEILQNSKIIPLFFKFQQ